MRRRPGPDWGAGPCCLSLMSDSWPDVAKLRHRGGLPRAEVASDGIADGDVGLGGVADHAAVGPFDPAVAERRSQARRPPRGGRRSRGCGRSLRVRSCAVSCSASLTRTTTCGACGKLLEAFGGERGDLGERLAQHELGRELAARSRTASSTASVSSRRSIVGERRGPAGRARRRSARRPRRCGARRRRCLPSRRRQSRRGSPCFRPRRAGRRAPTARSASRAGLAPGGEVLVEQIFGSAPPF